MGAVKAQAIELLIKQDQSGDAQAFRMGLYAACHLILDQRGIYSTAVDAAGDAAWQALSAAFNQVFDAAVYLFDAETGELEPANGPVVD